MQKLAMQEMSRAAALALIVALPSVVVAAPSECQVPGATPLDQRLEQESQKGMPSFVRFIHRTRTVFQLDVATEVAKLDSRRATERECIARLDQPTTAGAATEQANPVPSVAATR